MSYLFLGVGAINSIKFGRTKSIPEIYASRKCGCLFDELHYLFICIFSAKWLYVYILSRKTQTFSMALVIKQQLCITCYRQQIKSGPRPHPPFLCDIMTSSNGNIFRVTSILCGEFTGHRWIPRTNASDAELWCFLSSMPEQTVE